MSKQKPKGQIYNHSSKDLFVIENDSKVTTVHILRPKCKSPSSIDVDGFKRADGVSLLGHKHWWKIIPLIRADIFQIGENLLIPVSLMRPVSDQEFGPYKVSEDPWGEDMVYVNGIIRNKKKKVIGYLTDAGRLSKREAVKLTRQNKLDNVTISTSSKGDIFLKAKKNMKIDDNLIV